MFSNAKSALAILFAEFSVTERTAGPGAPSRCKQSTRREQDVRRTLFNQWSNKNFLFDV